VDWRLFFQEETMARQPHPTDFRVSVPSVGEFTFARRTMRDEINVQVEYARIIQGVEATQWLQVVGGALADLRVLTVSAPPDWNLDDLDPLDDDSYSKLVAVQGALREKEQSFRRPKGPGAADQTSGA
jgi:hypothetical protein